MEPDEMSEVCWSSTKTRACARFVFDCYLCCDEFEKMADFSCGHEVCFNCLNSLRSLKCPFCRHELTSKDVGLKNYLQIQERQKKDKKQFQEESFNDFLENITQDDEVEISRLSLLVGILLTSQGEVFPVIMGQNPRTERRMSTNEFRRTLYETLFSS